MGAVYFVADTHFGHWGVMDLSKRPYETVSQMDEDIISRWNNRVKSNDTVYILGDMFFKCQYSEEIIARLKGKKHLIIGNHDTSWLEEYNTKEYKAKEYKTNEETTDTNEAKAYTKLGYRFTKSKVDLGKYFESVRDIAYIGISIRDKESGSIINKSCVLCHYPLLSWKHEKRLYMVHGHLHNDTEDSFFHHIAENERMLNAGVDINNFEPVTFEELIENNRIFKEAYFNKIGKDKNNGAQS